MLDIGTFVRACSGDIRAEQSSNNRAKKKTKPVSTGLLGMVANSGDSCGISPAGAIHFYASPKDPCSGIEWCS
jgi:hypothetical protein